VPLAEDCIFCKIAREEIPAQFVHQDEDIVAFPDINPQAPVHILVIPRRHYANVVEATASEPELIGRLFKVIAKVAGEKGLASEGFRVVCNTGPQGGQTVNHLHFHIIGGRFMTWPPG